jgi:hypothetical protein
MLMPCGHKVCRECTIEVESQSKPLVCFYDNSRSTGLADLQEDKLLSAVIEKEV